MTPYNPVNADNARLPGYYQTVRNNHRAVAVLNSTNQGYLVYPTAFTRTHRLKSYPVISFRTDMLYPDVAPKVLDDSIIPWPMDIIVPRAVMQEQIEIEANFYADEALVVCALVLGVVFFLDSPFYDGFYANILYTCIALFFLGFLNVHAHYLDYVEKSQSMFVLATKAEYDARENQDSV
jgi:hypothetical protein